MLILAVVSRGKWWLDWEAVQKSSGSGKFYEEIGRSLGHLLMMTGVDRCNQLLDSNAN
ncbi:MAG: hypothetical protein LH702_07400 [Phormidesmis sp. CAN_BIN44]|nr:hypothetical protein [Phormidesmis sp. CAN_BIN44]